MVNWGLRAAVTGLVVAEGFAVGDVLEETPAEHFSVSPWDQCAPERQALEDLCDANSHRGGNTGLRAAISCSIRGIQKCLVRNGISETDAGRLSVTCSSYNTTDWSLKEEPSFLPCAAKDGEPQASR